MSSLVSAVPAADSGSALKHFEAGLAYETDCSDVHASLGGAADFVLIDVRSEELYARAHVPGALHIPHGKIIASRLAHYPPATLFVVYCSGPHCNGAQRGAIRLARLGRPVKIMIGGMSGWLAEGFAIEHGTATHSRAAG